MKIYEIKCSDKGEYQDITRFLNDILIECRSIKEEKLILFEKGEYHFYQDFCTEEIIYASNTDSDKFPVKRIAINIHNIKNLTIDGYGSDFYMHGKIVPVKVTDSENITLKNFSWDFPSPTVLEMKVITSNCFSAEYSIPEGTMWDIKNGKLHWFDKSPFTGQFYWEEYNDGESYCNVIYDEENSTKCRHSLNVSPFNLAIKLRKIDNNTVKINYIKKLSKHYKPFNIFEMCSSKRRDCVGSFFAESRNISVQNVNVHYMSGFGWLTQMCENVSFIGCSFSPNPLSDKNCTSFADLIHVSGAKGKIHIEGCNFSHAHDDPINIHGTYTRVKKMLNKNTLVLEYVHNQQNGFAQYHEGDKVIFYNRGNFVSVENEKEFTVKNITHPLCGGNSVKEMVVEFYDELPDVLMQKQKHVCENVTYTPEVYIGSCSFNMIPTRGILCTTRRKALIENNTFDNHTMASIYLSNDCNDWYESGPIYDMTIRNNIFNVRKSPVYKGNKGAIFIEPIVAEKSDDVPAVHHNITIENNIFNMEHDNVINAAYTDKIIFRNNEVYSIGNECISAFALKKCSDVILNNNFYSVNVNSSADNTK